MNKNSIPAIKPVKQPENRSSQLAEEWRATNEKMEVFYQKQVSVLQDALRASNEQNKTLCK